MDNVELGVYTIDPSIIRSYAHSPNVIPYDEGTIQNHSIMIDMINEVIIPETSSDSETTVVEVIPNNDTIRPNSATLLIDETSSRFSSAIWAEAIKKEVITLAGIGGIGSYVGFLLSRVKPERIIIYDPDIVDSTNMSGQLYSRLSVGNSKVSALNEFMRNYSSYYSTYVYSSEFNRSSPASPVMICGFDNMSARKTFYESWKIYVESIAEEDQHDALFIDGRLAAEEFQVFCIKGDDFYHMKQYEDKWLFSDEEADNTICSYKQTSHCASMIASIIVNLFVNFVANKCEPLIERDLPFLTSYDASTMYFKTIS